MRKDRDIWVAERGSDDEGGDEVCDATRRYGVLCYQLISGDGGRLSTAWGLGRTDNG